MTLADLLKTLPPKHLGDLPFPRALLGAFRRKSISFCTGLTDERTIVYWFQSKSFTIDLRLPDAAATPVTQRQGWVGDTLWDEGSRQLSWTIERSYQPHDQWPEPARLDVIGNSIIEFAPSGAYVEDWRQQSSRGPFLGLRLVDMRDGATGQIFAMDGGLIVAGDHMAYVQSRLPALDTALRTMPSLERALLEGFTLADIESYEASVATGSDIVTHSTRPERRGQPIAANDFAMDADGSVLMSGQVGGKSCVLRFAVDIHLPDFTFDCRTPATPQALEWMEREKHHLARHAVVVR